MLTQTLGNSRTRPELIHHSEGVSVSTDVLVIGGGPAGCWAPSGIRRQRGDAWSVRAGAVAIAGGGCAFQSAGLGCNVLTGDGHLMAAELGAELSGMEFSNAYALSPAFSSVTKTAFYRYATFYTDDGVLEGAGAQRGRSIIARELLSRPVYARLDRAPADIRTEREFGWSEQQPLAGARRSTQHLMNSEPLPIGGAIVGGPE
jgi:succinate dehydrogenase/fumarate reductase flavoprotein subunit